MPEYVFTGKVMLRGATFYVTAWTLEEAIQRVKRGESDEIDTRGGELYDWDIDASSGKENG